MAYLFKLSNRLIVDLIQNAYTQSRKLYENRISSWYGALQQILNNIPKLKQLSTNQKVFLFHKQFKFLHKFSIFHQNICSYLGPIDAYVLLEVFS
jgi:hypothetical protein